MIPEQDFSETVVPSENRTNGINILFVWMGFILVVASMSFGGGLASQMPLPELITAIIAGNVVLAIIAFFSGYIGSHSGLSFGSLAADVFPKGTWRLALLYIPISLIGWYAINAAIFGNFIADIFEFNDILRRFFMSGVALFFSISAYIGMRFMGKVSLILVPLVVLISIFALFNVDGTQLSFNFSEVHINLWTGIGIVMSTWIFSVLLIVPDLTRFIKGPIRAGTIAATGIFIANVLALSIGAFAAAYTQQYDPSLVLVGIGFVPLAILLSFAGIWSTNDNNMYSSALSVSRMFSMPRRSAVFGLALIGAVIAFFNPATISIMFSFLIFMSISAPPLGGLVLGIYFYQLKKPHKEVNVFVPWIAWLGASTVVFFMQGVFVIPVGILLGFVFWLILAKLLPTPSTRTQSA